MKKQTNNRKMYVGQVDTQTQTQTRWVHGSHCGCCPQLMQGPHPCTGSGGHPLSAWNTHLQVLQRTEPQPEKSSANPANRCNRKINKKWEVWQAQSSSYYKATMLQKPNWEVIIHSYDKAYQNSLWLMACGKNLALFQHGEKYNKCCHLWHEWEQTEAVVQVTRTKSDHSVLWLYTEQLY